MYPSLTPVGKSSHWYTAKQTIQEKAQEISYLEDKIEAKRLNDIQVGIPILIRGQPILPTKITTIGGKEDDDEEEGVAADEDDEQEAIEEDVMEDTSNPHMASDEMYGNMYDHQMQDDDDEDGMPPANFNYDIYRSDSE